MEAFQMQSGLPYYNTVGQTSKYRPQTAERQDDRETHAEPDRKYPRDVHIRFLLPPPYIETPSDCDTAHTHTHTHTELIP